MSSRLRAKSLEEHHLLRAVQYPNFVNDGIHQDNIMESINVIDEAVNQYHQTKIHNKIINQHIISDDRISQRKRGRSSTGSIGIASVPRLSFKSTWMPRGIVGMMLLAFATRMMFFFSNWQSTCHSLQSFLFEGPERYRKMFSTEQPWQLPNLRSQEVASWHDACSCNYL
jgi:hypothetical protein